MTPFLLRGGGNAYFFRLQNPLSQDWSVVGCSNLFWLTLWTLPALFGARTPPKSMCLSKPNLSKFDEWGHSSNFEKWSPNLIGSHLRPLERIIMHFWAILTPQEASNNPMNDPLLSRKKDRIFVFWRKVVEIRWAPKKWQFFGGDCFRLAPKGS